MALVENGVLQEIFIERVRSRGIVGNIYKGKVVRVLPGMQAAFVDIGLERAAFIHASEIAPRRSDKGGEEQIQTGQLYELVHEGQSLVVQVTKDPLGTKGATTDNPCIYSCPLPGTYAPGNNHVGISLRIEDAEERERLRQMVEANVWTAGQPGKAGWFYSAYCRRRNW